MADSSGLFGLMGNDSGINAASILRSRVKQPLYQAAMENAEPTHEQFLRRPENSVLPDWMSNSSSNSVMGKIDPNDPYGIEQARNANPTANEEAGLEMPMLADPYNYVGMGLGTGAANAVGKFVAPKANEMLENYMVKSGMQLPVFAGVGAKNADRAAYNIASKMKQAGVADREIHAQTGWTFGFPDGRPRFEIDDSAAKGHFTHLPPSTDRLAEQAISHPSLYQAYPELSEISQLGLKEAKEAGRFTPTYIDDAYSGGSILAKAPDETGLKSIGLHELQHAVQQQEGFARGGSPNIELSMLANSARAKFRKGSPLTEEESQLAKLTPIEAARPYDIYRRLAGEAEARLTQARMNMTQAERAASYPPSMFDVPVDQQIVRFGDGPAMSTNTFNQPLVNALRKPTTKPEYQGVHQPPMRDSGAPLHDLTGGGLVYPDDIYSKQAAQYYGHTGQNDPMDRQTIALIQSFKNKPNSMVTMYRAVPNDTQQLINSGDWVTVNKAYAKDHGDRQFDGNYKILSQKVKASDLFTNGDSIHEFGYDPENSQLVNALRSK